MNSNNQKAPDSNAFIPPALDGYTDILELVNYNVSKNPNHPLFQYARDEGTGVHTILWSQFGRAALAVAHSIRANSEGLKSNTGEQHVIAILAYTDSVTYSSLIVGIMLAGCVPFPISLRNSAEGIAHLLASTKCQEVYISDDKSTSDLFRTSNLQLKSNSIELKTFAVPTFDELTRESIGDLAELQQNRHRQEESICIIYHSSGSTNHPKLIYLTCKMIYQWGVVSAYREASLGREIISLHGLPLYHIMGFCVFLSCVTIGSTAAAFAPGKTRVISPDVVLRAATASMSNILFTFPSFLETWAKTKKNLETLKKFKAVVYGGGPLAVDIGNTLLEQGIPFSPSYGATELGCLTLFLPSGPRPEGWEWMKTAVGADLAFVPQPEMGPDVFKLVIKKRGVKTPAVLNTTIDGVPAYDIGDLVTRHPTDPTLWKVWGREDAQIIHSSGENTNSIPIEDALQKDPRIAAAIMFGRARLRAGVIILPSPEFIPDPTDVNKEKEYRDMIWETISKVNKASPQHSRIFRDMIIIASPDRPFEYTVKGFPRRASILKAYHDDIERLYKEDDQDPVQNINTTFDLPSLKKVVREIVTQGLTRSIGDNEDIFVNGGDSLTASYIRSTLIRSLQHTSIDMNTLPRDVVFMFPSTDALSGFIYGILLMTRKPDVTPEKREPTVPKFVSVPKGTTGNHLAVVKLCEGNGEVPLILLPALVGSSMVFLITKEKYKSALWALETVTRSEPFSDLDDLTTFLYDEVKKELPHGPYRIAAYSGSSPLAISLTLLFEKAGDKVIQLGFLDHFPSVYQHPIQDLSTFHPGNPADLEVYIKSSVRSVTEQMFASKAKSDNARLLEQALRAFVAGDPVAPYMGDAINRMVSFLTICVTFIFGDRFRVDGVWKRELYIAWLKGVKVTPTVYLPTRGTVTIYEDPEGELQSGLGAREAFPDARVVVVQGDHFEILTNEEVIRDLQDGFV